MQSQEDPTSPITKVGSGVPSHFGPWASNNDFAIPQRRPRGRPRKSRSRLRFTANQANATEPVRKAHQTNTTIASERIQTYGLTSTVPVKPICHPGAEPIVYHKVAVQRPSCPKRRLFHRIFKGFCSRPSSEDTLTRTLDARKSVLVKVVIGACIAVTLLWFWNLEAQDPALGEWIHMVIACGHISRPLRKPSRRLRQGGETFSTFGILSRQHAHSSGSV